MSIYKRAEKEIDILERDLENEPDPIERKKTEREIRDIERDLCDEERFYREKQEDDEAYMERLYREGRD